MKNKIFDEEMGSMVTGQGTVIELIFLMRPEEKMKKEAQLTIMKEHMRLRE